MYKEYLKLRPCKTGNGVFTTVEIPTNIPILEVTGDLYLEHELPDPNHPALLQVGPNTFIGPSGDLDDYINHSCNPNCAVRIAGNRAILYSLYVIPKNTELTFDYSTTSTDTPDKWQMNCLCGFHNCRRVISGHQTIDPKTAEIYKQKRMFPLYITNPEMVQKRFE